MDKKIYLNLLYDYYKDLLTDKQRLYFEDYYCNDLSLSEIAENESVSRNAVHGQLKIIEERLEELEKALGLLKKREYILKLVENKLDNKTFEKIDNIL